MIFMMITRVTQQNMDAFAPLIPEELLYETADSAHFALGAVMNGGESSEKEAADPPGYAVGILLYELIEDEGEPPYVQLKWIYTAQEFRKQGVADVLMETFYTILNESGISNLMCELPASPDDDLLCAFLRAWGFSFSWRKKYELTLTLEELLDDAFFEEQIDLRAVRPLNVLSRTQINRKLEQLSVTNERAKQLLKPGGWDLVDAGISCGTVENGEIRGLFLIRQQLSGMLEPVFLYTGREQKADIPSMFQFAAIQAYLKYPTDTRMHVVCRSDAVAVLVERMFPDREPLVVRHGEVRRQ